MFLKFERSLKPAFGVVLPGDTKYLFPSIYFRLMKLLHKSFANFNDFSIIFLMFNSLIKLYYILLLPLKVYFGKGGGADKYNCGVLSPMPKIT